MCSPEQRMTQDAPGNPGRIHTGTTTPSDRNPVYPKSPGRFNGPADPTPHEEGVLDRHSGNSPVRLRQASR